MISFVRAAEPPKAEYLSLKVARVAAIVQQIYSTIKTFYLEKKKKEDCMTEVNMNSFVLN